MDPITQGTFGGVFAQLLSSKKKIFSATVIGFLAGLAPDLDFLIRSSTDPLLHLEYHRQFTHSLIFVPIGALIVSLISKLIFIKFLSFKEILARILIFPPLSPSL